GRCGCCAGCSRPRPTTRCACRSCSADSRASTGTRRCPIRWRACRRRGRRDRASCCCRPAWGWRWTGGRTRSGCAGRGGRRGWTRWRYAGWRSAGGRWTCSSSAAANASSPTPKSPTPPTFACASLPDGGTPPGGRLRVGDAVGDVAGGDVVAGGGDVLVGVVEEDVRAERLQERALGPAAEEQRLVQAHAPLAQGADYPLVRRRRARGHQRGADRRIVARRERRLQPVQRVEETAERPTGKRLAGALQLVAPERLDAVLARHPLAFVAEDHRVAVEGDPQLIVLPR